MVFAGLTVVIALAGLPVVGVPMLTKMGLAAAGTVVVAVLIALTMIPALLRRRPKIRPAGEKRGKRTRATSPRSLPGAGQARHGHPLGPACVIRRPAAVLLLGVVGLVRIAVPATQLELGLPDDGSQPTSTTQRRAYDLLSKGFGPGFDGPLMIVVDAKNSDDPKTAATAVTDGVKGLKDVVTVTPAAFNKAGDTATITVIPGSKPSSVQTEDLSIHRGRAPTPRRTRARRYWSPARPR
ncbi:MMPL family transporter OS=Streptomyces alboniger OX=132473 GN=CP975_14590 PE=4 SV=1 [Streptomyces alboniger]